MSNNLYASVQSLTLFAQMRFYPLLGIYLYRTSRQEEQLSTIISVSIIEAL